MSSSSASPLLLGQALQYLDNGDPAGADVLIETHLARQPDDADGHLLAGICKHRLGDFDAAFVHFAHAKNAKPGDAGITLAMASAYADAGEADKALSCIDEVLTESPRNVEAILARSVLSRRMGDGEEAVAAARMAVVYDRNSAEAHYTLGLALIQNHRLQDAETAFQRVTELKPDFAGAWLNLGVVQKDLNQFEAAESSYRTAIGLDPEDALIHNNLGNLHAARDDYDAAKVSYRRALEFDPDYVEAKVNLALAERETGSLDAAIAALEEAARRHPDHVAVLNSLGNSLRQAHRFDEAIEVLKQAVTLAPDHGEACNNLGLAMTIVGRRDEAEFYFRRAKMLRPDLPVIANNLGSLLLRMFRFEEAIESLTDALAADPDYEDALVNLGVAHFMRGHHTEAIEAYRRVMAVNPENAFARYSMAVALLEEQSLEEALEEIQATLDLQPQNEMALNTYGVVLLELHRTKEARDAMGKAAQSGTMSAPVYFSNMLFTSLYLPDIGNDEVEELHREFGRIFASGEPDPERPHAHVREPARKLKLGYVSPDFRAHSVAYFMEALIEKHDRSQYELYLYSNTTRVDEVTDAMAAAADVWVETAGLTDEAMLDRMRADEIDILVNLGGHTSGNRLPVLARKPSPVQIEYLGYPETSGVTAMDYRLTDLYADPEGEADARCVETLIRLPDCFHCYRPNAQAPDVAPAPFAKAGYITFASFNVLPKVNNRTIGAWAEILKAVPKSRFYIKCKQLRTERVQHQILEDFAAAGIDPDRIDMGAFVPSVREHLDQYAKVDLALDTFPYNGTTTSCEALWMGVPVLTIAGGRHTGRVGNSLLSAVGLAEELVAGDVDDYIARAVDYARNPERLAAIRKDLRTRMAASPLRDEAGFTRNLEETYRRLWRQWCEGATTFEHKAAAPLTPDDSVQGVLTRTV